MKSLTLKPSESLIRNHLERQGFECSYEEPHDRWQPDFTVRLNQELVAVVEVKDIELSDAERAMYERALEGEPRATFFDPYQQVREKIRASAEQFRGVKDHPCVLIVQDNTGMASLDPIFILGAMMGDLGISMRVSTVDGRALDEPQSVLAQRGKMIDPKRGRHQHTRIAAIGVVRSVKPDVERLGLREQFSELLKKVDSDNRGSVERYLHEAKQLEEKLTRQGFDLGRIETAIVYVKNPIAARPFPAQLAGGQFDQIYDYNLDSGEFIRSK